jgi:hypothetical protein
MNHIPFQDASAVTASIIFEWHLSFSQFPFRQCQGHGMIEIPQSEQVARKPLNC